MAERVMDLSTPGVIEVGGPMVLAPGFTPEQFDRAIQRAHNDGIVIEPSEMPYYVVASNPTNGARYTVSRLSCTCPAGRKAENCKHRAMAIFMADVTHELKRRKAA